jgi:hypothetical protein
MAVLRKNDEIFDRVIIEGGGLAIPEHDHIGMTYTGSDLTEVVYKSGGAGGTVVATLTLTYGGSGNLLTVTRS